MQADGSKTRKTLGPAWVRDSGRKSPRGAVVWRAANGSKPDHTYLTPKEAQDALDVLLAAERAKPSSAPRVGGKTFGDAAAEWLAHSEGVRGVAPTTLAGYRVMVRVLQEEEWPGTLQLRRIVTRRVEQYQERLLAEGNLGRDSIRQRMLVLRGILTRARELGWIAVNPATDVKIVAQPRTNPDFNVLEPTQVEAVATAIASTPEGEPPRMRNGEVDERSLEVMLERRKLYAEAVRLAAYTGLRFGELRALQWRDVNRAGESLLIRRSAPADAPIKAPKSGRGRSVPLIAPALAALDRIADAGYATGLDDLVLPTRAGGMLESGRVRDAFYGGLRAAGLGHLREKDNPMTFHDLRHTFGTLAVRKLPVTDVQEYMGHADIQTTMRYVHHVPRTDAARRLSEAFESDLAEGPHGPPDAAAA
jgi:integrase